MEPITLRTLIDVVGGTLLGDYSNLDAVIAQVDTDSRSIRPGSLFIPLEGERFDAHAFIPDALDAGAAGCLTARVRETDRPGKFYIKVESTQRALRDLARWYRGQFDIPVIAVTGSVGKTTTKDMVAAVLGERVASSSSSPLRMATPLSSIWPNTSHFARKMPSRLPKYSMWQSPMLVIRATSGRAMSAR